MNRRLGFVFAWAVITGLSVLIATQAVGTIRDQVTDSPATLATVAADVLAADATTSVPPATLETTTTTSTTLVDEVATTTTTSTTIPDEPSTTSTAAPTTTTRAPTTTTTTTQAPAAMETATYQLEGGWVRIRYGGGEVYLVDAAPRAGYSMKVERNGPLKVEVEFEGHDYEGKFEADMEDGPLDVDIQEKDDD